MGKVFSLSPANINLVGKQRLLQERHSVLTEAGLAVMLPRPWSVIAVELYPTGSFGPV